MFIVLGLLAGLPAALGCLGVILGCSSCCGNGGGYNYQNPYYAPPSPYAAQEAYSYPPYGPSPAFYPPPSVYSQHSYVPLHHSPYAVPARPSFYPRMTYSPLSMGTLPLAAPPRQPAYIQPSPVYPSPQVQVSAPVGNSGGLVSLPQPTYNQTPFIPPKATAPAGSYAPIPPTPVLVEATTPKVDQEEAPLLSFNNSYGEKGATPQVVAPTAQPYSAPPKTPPQEVTNSLDSEYETQEDHRPEVPLVGVVTQSPEIPEVTDSSLEPNQAPYVPPVSGYPNESTGSGAGRITEATSSPAPTDETEYTETEQEGPPYVGLEDENEDNEVKEKEWTNVNGGRGDDGNDKGYGKHRLRVQFIS